MSVVMHKGYKFEVMSDGSGVASALHLGGAIISVVSGRADKVMVNVVPSRHGSAPRVARKVLKLAEGLCREVVAMQSPQWHAKNRALYGEDA